MKIDFRATSAALVIGLAGVPAWASDFPSKPIEMIVPYGAGGLTDAFARGIARAAQAHLPNNQNIIVVNKPGGAATIGMTAAAKAKPDGHTIAFVTSSPVALQPLDGATPYKPEDFQPIIRTYDIPASINVRADSEIKDFDQWLAWVKEHPGEFTYGTSGGTGSGLHVATEQLAAALGVELRHIPFEGSAQLTTSLMGGQLMGTSQLPDLHNGGEVRPIIFETPSKPEDPVYDAIPTTQDKGIDAQVVLFSGIVGSADIPADRIQVLHDAFKAAMDDPAVQHLYSQYQLTPAYAGPEEFGKIIATAVENNTKTMRKMGLIK